MSVSLFLKGVVGLAVVVLFVGCGGGGGGGGTEQGGEVGGGGNGSPAAPTTIASTTLSESSIRVDWNNISTNETGIYIERSASISGPWTQFVLPENTETFTDSGLGASGTYHYRVAAFNDNGISPYVGP